jgi:Family of unknown function (DUF6424)
MVLLPLGIEWSAQFAAEPRYVDEMRQIMNRLIAGFPLTLPGYEELGYTDARRILDTPIVDAATVADWVDSIFNAGVPLPADAHTSVLPRAGSYHHYPKPIVDIEFFKRDDFNLWVSDQAGRPVAVVPLAPKGSGDGRVAVLYTEPGSELHQTRLGLHAQEQELILEADSPLAQAAFARQSGQP